MKCNDFKNLITEYLENTGSPLQRRQVESHLSECETCRALAAREESVIKQLRALPIESCPDEIIDQVMETIDEPPMSLINRIRSWLKVNPSWRYGLASLSGTVAIALLVTFLFIPNQNKHTMGPDDFTAVEIEQAKKEAELALAYFAVYSSKTTTALQKIRIVEPAISPIELKIKKALNKIPYI